MARVEFHFNVPDRVAYVCRLIRKALALDHRIGVLAPERLVVSLDQALWTLSPLDFLPHCQLPATDAIRAASPVWLSSQSMDLPTDRLLIQLDVPVPANASAYERIIEVVSGDAAERQDARNRWREYAQQGHELIQHNFLQSPPTAG